MEVVCREEDRPIVSSLFECLSPVSSPSTTFYLAFDDGVLSLCRRGDGSGIWVEERDIKRRLSGPFLLGRACGLAPGSAPHVLDATAGLGIDGLALARRGARVELTEREPLLWALLRDLLRRLDEPEFSLTRGDSRRSLEDPTVYDVVYFDPMFPPRRKSALPGKRMQYLSSLLGDSEAFDMDLIQKAQLRARSRVVLKRRLKDPVEQQPDWTLRGRSIRYDVYRGLA